MPSKPKIHSKLNNSEGKMKNEQALKYRNLLERAAGFPLFLDGIEATCSQESSAAFLYMQDEYMQDEDEPETPEHRDDDIVRDIPLRSKLDFTHFKRHKRGNLQYDGTEWRGVSVHRSWRSIVKNPPTPTTSGYAQR